jgi:hypothetical protein
MDRFPMCTIMKLSLSRCDHMCLCVHFKKEELLCTVLECVIIDVVSLEQRWIWVFRVVTLSSRILIPEPLKMKPLYYFEMESITTPLGIKTQVLMIGRHYESPSNNDIVQCTATSLKIKNVLRNIFEEFLPHVCNFETTH